MRRGKLSAALALSLPALTLFVALGSPQAQTMVPKLDVDGRRGDIARLAKQRAQEKFNAADTDQDGKLSRREVDSSFPYLADKFAAHDKDGDGFLSWEEYLGHDRWPR
ncbi:MAG: EF-hand protein [Proteobacteria bacterium]|nr:EF-hand protein [Pseudomonadota bacterium]